MVQANTEFPYKGAVLQSCSDESAADTALTITTPATGRPFKLIGVYAKYSGSVTKDVTITKDAGLGAAYDNLLTTIAIAAGTEGNYLPNTDRIFRPDDVLVVVAEAGGGVITSTLVVDRLLL